MVRCDFVFGGMFAQAPCSLTSALIQSASYPRSANNIVRGLNSRPLQSGLEAATRALSIQATDLPSISRDRLARPLEHWGEFAGAKIFVKTLGKAFEVDIGGMHVTKELDPRLRRNVASAHGHRLDAPLAAGLRYVDCIFGKITGSL